MRAYSNISTGGLFTFAHRISLWPSTRDVLQSIIKCVVCTFLFLFIRFAWPTPMISRGSSKRGHFHKHQK